ncbi:MAG TPA: TrkH family potassium uptake protein [Phycisphaerae bacterium]|nr:TrkH family potassium uptake protein [Phycisphaerae bacterium]HNU44122.1 TrkH family potassium uptake protein [Phycisphaerae bacterium]
MNFREVFHNFGLLLVVLSLILGITAAWSALGVGQGDPAEKQALLALLLSAGAGLTAGGLLYLPTRSATRVLGRREALLLVALGWLVSAALGALPFYLWAHLDGDPRPHPFDAFVNCYFEAMSGFTTTGATVLSKIASMPRSLLLWRALTHWLGGLGIVVLFVAVLPSLGVGGKRLFRMEAPGPEKEGVRPHIRETARILWLIYLGLTITQAVALRLAGMGWFDAVCHTFATLATGGFSTSDTSIGGYDSVAIDIIIIVFMVAAGVNFGLYYQLIRGRVRQVLQDGELRGYLTILLLGSLFVVVFLHGHTLQTTDGRLHDGSPARAALHGTFQAVSVQTTTGFCTADFNQWPLLARGVMILLMFIGASAGSTGGGIKVIRILICLKVLASEIERVFRPNVVRPVKFGAHPVDADLKLATLAYVLGILVLFLLGAGLLLALEAPQDIDFATAISASVATLCNIGPGLGMVGAVENYGWFTAGSKIVMCLLMALGRLEIFAIAVLFFPRFWRGD